MTFIIGMKCSDGLVLASDSLESDGVTCRYRNKLECIQFSEWGACWGVSGNAYVADRFSDALKRVATYEAYDRAKFEAHAEKCLHFIRAKYRESDQIQIALGLFGRPSMKKAKTAWLGLPEFHLYKGVSESACLSPEKEYAIAGMDVTLASFILENSYLYLMGMDAGTKLSVFVTSVMKKYAAGVGGEINVRTHFVGSGKWEPLLTREVSDIEGMFPVSGADDAIAKLWTNNPHHFDMDKETESQINKANAMKPIPKPSASHT